MQSIALLAVVLASSRAGCGEPAETTADAPPRPPDDAGWRPAIGDDGFVAYVVDAAPSACLDVKGCRAACESSGGRRADACVRWADMLRARHGTESKRDRIGAREIYRRTCDLTKDALACTRVALAAGFLHDLDLAPEWIDPQQAPLGMLAAACATDPQRGELACAALELLAPGSSLAREQREMVCRGDGAERAGCAAHVALEACRTDDPEGCYLAANEKLPTHEEARTRLRKLCGDEDRPACMYLFALSPPDQRDRDSLLAACSAGDRKDESLASACLARSMIKDPKDPEPRPARYADFACEIGSCQHPRLQNRPPATVLRRSCEAGFINGCANLVFTIRANPAVWKPIVEELNRKLPPYARRVPAEKPGDEVACELGSLDACTHASKRLAPTDPARAAQLQGYIQRLTDPFGVPAAPAAPTTPRAPTTPKAPAAP